MINQTPNPDNDAAYRDAVLSDLRSLQFTYAADALRDAAKYYSDSVHDELTDILDATLIINFLDSLDQLDAAILAPRSDDPNNHHLLDHDLAPQLLNYALNLCHRTLNPPIDTE